MVSIHEYPCRKQIGLSLAAATILALPHPANAQSNPMQTHHHQVANIISEPDTRRHNLRVVTFKKIEPGMKSIFTMDTPYPNAGLHNFCVDSKCEVTAFITAYGPNGSESLRNDGRPVTVLGATHLILTAIVWNPPPGRYEWKLPTIKHHYDGTNTTHYAEPTLNLVSIARTCVVPQTTVNLGPVNATAVQDAPPVSFDIALDCPHISTANPRYRVHMVMTNASYPEMQGTNVLTSPSTQDRGVGIEINRLTSQGGTVPVLFGPDSNVVGTTNQWLVGDNQSGALRQRFTARYTPLSEKITPGPIRATATVTLGYD
ncbi:fimbrial protein [Burkholderia contaminans]|uniref:fimbrial protein n=1 Tax=Burkholderia contaminans TaxID=488447 RepID=UPI0009D79398|nr:fimbrial protein [Burkholderia contaminans]